MEKYFLGSMAEEGFRSDFGKLIARDGVYTYILKGGAGTGKSSLMKKVAARFSGDNSVEHYFCSSDPDSMDAVYIRQANALIVDGTAPHTFDPEFPAVKQRIVNLGDHWDGEALRQSADDIIAVTLKHRGYMNTVRSYVSAMTKIFDDTCMTADSELDRKKLEAFAEKTAAKLLPKKKNAVKGSVRFSLLAAVSPKGYAVQTDTLADYDKLYVISDELYCAGDALLKKLADEAAERGYDITVSKCNMFSQSVYEFVLIKELGLAFALSTPMNMLADDRATKINAMRFYDKKGIAAKKQRLKMNKNACQKLLEEAVKTLSTAKKVHDDIEKYYIAAMDFADVDKATDALIKEIESRL